MPGAEKKGRSKIAKRWEKEYKNGGPVRVAIAKGCGKVMPNRRKKTKFYT